MTQPRTDKEIREWVKVQFEHLSKAQQRKIRDYLEYARDFYEDDGITPQHERIAPDGQPATQGRTEPCPNCEPLPR